MGSISYNVKYEGTILFKNQIDSVLVAFNKSLSTYIPDSEISLFNNEDLLTSPSRLFDEVLSKSLEIYQQTNGAFDPTVGPLINAWGFGAGQATATLDSAKVDSLLLLVGLEKVAIASDKITKDTKVYLDFSAIAKGQAVDEVGRFLENKGVRNYMVEIGGEVRCRGLNQSGATWTIGIEDPLVQINERKAMALVTLDDLSLATSGNYRNYYERDGRTYAHIIDPRTGYTADHNLLSASVFAKDCMIADAYATAFMVMGLEQSIKFVEANDELDAVFVYQTDSLIDVYESLSIDQSVELIQE